MESRIREEEVKIDFSNIVSFLSSLDYIRFLELSGAFEGIEGKELYFTNEKFSLFYFILKKVISLITLMYLFGFFVGSFIYSQNPVFVSFLLTTFYTFLGFLLVHRYTIPQGYLYVIFKDFLIWTLFFSFLFFVLSDLLLFYFIPKLLSTFAHYCLNIQTYVLFEFCFKLYPYFYKAYEFIYPYLYAYVYTSLVKFLLMSLIYAYFLFLSKKRDISLE